MVPSPVTRPIPPPFPCSLWTHYEAPSPAIFAAVTEKPPLLPSCPLGMTRSCALCATLQPVMAVRAPPLHPPDGLQRIKGFVATREMTAPQELSSSDDRLPQNPQA